MSELLYQRYIGSIQRLFSVEDGGSDNKHALTIGGYVRITAVSVSSDDGGLVITGRRVHDGMQHAVSCCHGCSKEALVETVFKEYSEELLRALATDTATLTDVKPLLAEPLSELKRSLLLQAQLGLDGMQMHGGTRPGTLAAKAEAAASRHVSQEVLKLLREELRPALQKCWSTEAANVASAVAASEDDRASTAMNSIDFIKGQLVQNGAEAAQKLRERLAGAWRSKEAGASQEKQLQAPEIFGDGEQWQRACESRLEEVRNLVSAFFAEGEQLGSNPGSSTSIGLVEEQINTLELELGGILCSAVADAALVPPLRDLTRMVKAPTPQQQAKALVLQRAYRLGAPSRSAQRAAFVRAGLSAAVSDSKLEAQRSGSSHATLSRAIETLSRWISAARSFAWIDTTAAKAARDELAKKAEAARKKEQAVAKVLKTHRERTWDAQEAEERLKQATAEGVLARKEAANNPDREPAAIDATNRVRSLEKKLEEAEQALVESNDKLARQDPAVLQAVEQAEKQRKQSRAESAAKGSLASTGSAGEQSSRVHSRDAFELSRALGDSMQSLLGRLREGLVDTLAGPDRAVEKACVAVQETVSRVMGSAVLAHDRAMEPIVAAALKLKDELQQLQQKREKAVSKREFDEMHAKKLQALDAAAPQMMDVAGLKEQAKKLNPVVGFFDPLNLAEGEFWGDSNAATIGFLRESEIKHGRIAMFGFVGYIVHANGIHWPTKGPWDNIPTDISPQEMWDQTPEVAKWQIILTISFLEFWRENAYVLKADGEAHYMRGGKPGYFPTFDQLPHPVPFNLFDPFKLSKNKTPEQKAKGLITEINNGRLAMIGLFGFLAESQTPGSVPGLAGVGLKPYAGNIMAPFDANFHIF